MTASLARFQDEFAQALFVPQPAAMTAMAALASQPGFAVYRNTVMKGCIDALEANYRTVAQLVGTEWFRAAAAVYVSGHLPEDASMLYYGQNFPSFLTQFAPAAELPYLPDVARLDRLWSEAHAAESEPLLDTAEIARLKPEELANAMFHPHASARWAWFASGPIYTIWQKNRHAPEHADDIVWHAEGALLVRPAGEVNSLLLDAAGCAFLDACKTGCSFAEAAQAALAAQEDADIGQLVASLQKAGTFSRISLFN